MDQDGSAPGPTCGESLGDAPDLGFGPRVSAPRFEGSAAYLTHGPAGPDELDLVDRMAGPFGTDAPLDGGGDLVVARPAAQQRTQVELVEGEQARPQLTVGREADAVARLAEGVGHAGDHADVAAPVAVPE